MAEIEANLKFLRPPGCGNGDLPARPGARLAVWPQKGGYDHGFASEWKNRNRRRYVPVAYRFAAQNPNFGASAPPTEAIPTPRMSPSFRARRIHDNATV
jgi:hypothetical protein